MKRCCIDAEYVMRYWGKLVKEQLEGVPDGNLRREAEFVFVFVRTLLDYLSLAERHAREKTIRYRLRKLFGRPIL